MARAALFLWLLQVLLLRSSRRLVVLSNRLLIHDSRDTYSDGICAEALSPRAAHDSFRTARCSLLLVRAALFLWPLQVLLLHTRRLVCCPMSLKDQLIN